MLEITCKNMGGSKFTALYMKKMNRHKSNKKKKVNIFKQEGTKWNNISGGRQSVVSDSLSQYIYKYILMGVYRQLNPPFIFEKRVHFI